MLLNPSICSNYMCCNCLYLSEFSRPAENSCIFGLSSVRRIDCIYFEFRSQWTYSKATPIYSQKSPYILK
ncbi:unnamed protein product [Meloidogyne enterolobii]|uniref:Uncharacterized protein n=1 Tax=Meloidogyne enterolobii TaxID=390850 RepID=A0ACB0ZPB0_MELEN